MENKKKILTPDVFDLGENVENYYVEVKQLKKGDVFYESTKDGTNYMLTAISDSKRTKNGWICKVKTSEGEVLDFFVTATTENHEFSYPTPNLFWAPQHLTKLDNGKFVYEIC